MPLDLPPPVALPSVEEDLHPLELVEVSGQIAAEVSLVSRHDDQGLNPVAGQLVFRWFAFLCHMDPCGGEGESETAMTEDGAHSVVIRVGYLRRCFLHLTGC